ncbi:GtrA family protein [Kiritimatiellota bacterium B12222]|nr:GtrA family protein [Kiritimatiellota bacterium B12222]
MALDFSGLPPLWDVKGWLRAILSREQHPLLQFIRYGISGVAAMAANVLAFWICIQWFYPASPDVANELEMMTGGVGGISQWWSTMRHDPQVAAYVKANTVAFLLSNIVAYVLNFKWVFQGGRHSRQVEILLFFVVSLFSFVLGTAMASVLVGSFGVHEYVAKISDVVFAILINYLCRKFLVFKN